MVHRRQGDAGLKTTEGSAIRPEKKTSGIVETFEGLFARTRPAFSQERIFSNARALAAAALLNLGRQTVTGMLSAIGRQFEDWTSAYRLFSKERIDRAALFAPAREAVVERLKPDEPMVVVMDDTLIRKRGRKIPGTAWKRDPLGPPFHTNFVWGQRFLQLSAALPDASTQGCARGIPIDFLHAPSAAKPRKNASPEAWETYRKEQAELKVSAVAAKRLRELRRQVSGKSIICAVDGGFTNRTVFRNVPDDTVLIGRIRKDASLFKAPEAEGAETSRRGRKRVYGDALPTPEEIRRDDSIPWQSVEAYAAGKVHTFDVKTISAVRWRGTGNHDIRLVVVRPLAYRPRKGAKLLYRDPAYLICTDAALPLESLLQAYLWRWEIELNFRDEKTVLGVGEAQIRKQPSVESVPSLVVASYACLLLAGTAADTGQSVLPRQKWRPFKKTKRYSTQDMISLFRTQLWRIGLKKNLTHFASDTSTNANMDFLQNSLHSAVMFAQK
ncbi:MAG: transposase [Synergistaceae bacterium]|nr:transposase [Synergistaceae bacterium]